MLEFAKIAEAHPHPHQRYVVVRGAFVFTATPCYGMHQPWWVVKTLVGEADPVSMLDSDQWLPLLDVSGVLPLEGENAR